MSKNKSNIIIRTISILTAAGVILTAYGCKGSSNPQSGELNQPSVGNGEAIIEYTITDKDGKETNETKKMEVDDQLVNQLSTGITLDKAVDKDDKKEDIIKDYKEDYNLNDKDAENIVNNTKTWVTFSYNLYVGNSNAKPVTFKDVTAKSTDDIKIKTSLECAYGLPSGVGKIITIEGIYNANKYKDAEDVKEALKSLNIQIPYATMESINDDIDDWDAVTTKLMNVTVE